MNRPETIEEIVGYVKERTPDNKVLLSFSGGKDAWGTWISIRDHFDITPFFYYLVPGLEFVEDYMAYAEKKLGCRIVRIPNPRFYEMLKGLVDQTPERCAILEAMRIGTYTWDDVQRAVEDEAGLPKMCWTALGVRAADSQRRALHFRQHGAVTDARAVFYPIWDWKKDQLVDAIKRDGIRLPVDYHWFGRSFDGTYLLFILNLKKHSPRDYQRVLEWFPMVETEVWKYERQKAQA